MPSIAPYTGGDLMGLASSAGAAVGRQRGTTFGPFDALSQAFNQGVMPEIQKQQKIKDNLQFVQDVVSTHPGIEHDPDFGLVLGAAHTGGDVQHAVQLFNSYKMHRESQDAINKYRDTQTTTAGVKAATSMSEAERKWRTTMGFDKAGAGGGYEPDGMGPPTPEGGGGLTHVPGSMESAQTREADLSKSRAARDATTRRGQNMRADSADSAEQGRNDRAGQSQQGMFERLLQSGKQAMGRVTAQQAGASDRAAQSQANKAELPEETGFTQAQQYSRSTQQHASALRSVWQSIDRDFNASKAEKSDAYSNYIEAQTAATEAANSLQEATQKRGDARRNRAKPASTNPSAGTPTVTTDDEYDALPSGTEFLDPHGQRRKKK